MRVFWIGVGSITALTLAVVYVAKERCKDRWATYNLEAIWSYETGCSVRIGGGLVREEYVSFDRRNLTAPPAGGFAKPAEALARPDWVILGPSNVAGQKNAR
ncbi:hypothetical protein [Bradyrhizobium icense]|uniref:hypothetical protein n=1 Tax=Bradyrhizobium icense TaxID=1274631 RepID=UPI0012EA86F5|nr:hypothetical protein [Bradyrhizobium icense]